MTRETRMNTSFEHAFFYFVNMYFVKKLLQVLWNYFILYLVAESFFLCNTSLGNEGKIIAVINGGIYEKG